MLFASRIQSFRYAFRGLWQLVRSQANARIHACATLAVVAAGVIIGITRYEWCLITLACVAVWAAEALNTAIEWLADAASPEFHPLIQNAKDVAAGAVLIAAMGSVIIGILVFGPYLF